MAGSCTCAPPEELLRHLKAASASAEQQQAEDSAGHSCTPVVDYRYWPRATRAPMQAAVQAAAAVVFALAAAAAAAAVKLVTAPQKGVVPLWQLKCTHSNCYTFTIHRSTAGC
eukprot:scaffold6514_cov21-Tisochrysis_lutea.AAC.4